MPVLNLQARPNIRQPVRNSGFMAKSEELPRMLCIRFNILTYFWE